MEPGLLIVGPTAGGKSSLAMGVVRALRARGRDAELVSADAYQIYRGMDIGTAKPTPDERAEVVHHLIDIREPTEAYSVHDWLRDAERTIGEIRARDHLPIVVGGTHLYAKALLDGLFEGPEPDRELRETLSETPLPDLREELARIDPAAAYRIHPNDRRRTVRAVEVFRQTGVPISEHQRQWDRGSRQDVRPVVIEWDAEGINPRINRRVLEMLDQGLEAEARALWLTDRLGPQAREALGYKQLIDHFERRCRLGEAVERIKIETRRFAKSQRTWMRRLRAGEPTEADTSPPTLRLRPSELDEGGMVAAVLGTLGG